MKRELDVQLHRLTLIALFSLCAVLLIPIEAQPSCGENTGHTERNSYYAPAIQTQMVYTVYLPPCYSSTDDVYPAVYLMHGSNEDDNHWLRLGLADALDEGISAGELPSLIVVLPFGNWIANRNQFGTDSWNNVFLSQLMPLVEGEYRIDARRESRVIGGVSRGGFWAFNIALNHPELFSAVGGHSAFFDLYHAGPENNPLDLIVDAPDIDSLRIAIDRGADDYAAPGLDIMEERLNERGLDYTYTIYPEGEHNNSYWSQHIGDYLRFYTAQWVGRDTELAVPEATAESTRESVPESTAQVMPVVTPQSIHETGWYLLLPAVAFPSLEANIPADRLHSIRLGLLEPNLVLTEAVAATIEKSGITLAPGTRIVPTDTLYNVLWRERSLFTLLPFDQLTPRYRVLRIDEVHPLDMNLSDYPFAFQNDTPNYHPERLTRLLLSGVTALTRQTREALDEHGIEWAGRDIVDYVSQPDFFHVSNEVSIYPTCPQTTGPMYGGALSFCSKAEHFELLVDLDVDIVELTGNHNNDFGYDAYQDTLQWYDDHDIATVGGGETLEEARAPLLLYDSTNSIAMVSCNWIGPYYALVSEDERARGGVRPGAAFCDRDWLQDSIPRLAAENDVLIVSVQYLEHDQYTPTAQQRNDFRWLASLGADVVVGTQAHFPQTFDFVSQNAGGESFVHYGLGNLFFDQRFFGGVRFFMDQLFIYKGRLLTVDLFTGIIEGQGRPRPMTPDERYNFLYMMFVQHGGF